MKEDSEKDHWKSRNGCMYFAQGALWRLSKSLWSYFKIDGGGSIYHDTPEVDTTLKAYYETLQLSFNEGKMPELIDTQNVALRYTIKDFEFI